MLRLSKTITCLTSSKLVITVADLGAPMTMRYAGLLQVTKYEQQMKCHGDPLQASVYLI